MFHIKLPCSNEKCKNKNKLQDMSDLKKCGKCRMARYCSMECQKVDWKARHKQNCKKTIRANNGIVRGTSKKSIIKRIKNMPSMVMISAYKIISNKDRDKHVVRYTDGNVSIYENKQFIGEILKKNNISLKPCQRLYAISDHQEKYAPVFMAWCACSLISENGCVSEDFNIYKELKKIHEKSFPGDK
jgi:hypothetical protein